MIVDQNRSRVISKGASAVVQVRNEGGLKDERGRGRNRSAQIGGTLRVSLVKTASVCFVSGSVPCPSLAPSLEPHNNPMRWSRLRKPWPEIK